MRYDDFCCCTLEEFEAVCNAWQSREDAEYKDNWERMRMLGTLSIQPHVRNKLTPHTLLPFSWDEVKPTPRINKEERDAAAAQAIEKFGNQL